MTRSSRRRRERERKAQSQPSSERLVEWEGVTFRIYPAGAGVDYPYEVRPLREMWSKGEIGFERWNDAGLLAWELREKLQAAGVQRERLLREIGM